MKNLRNCYAAFLLFALLFVSAAAPAQTDLQQKLGRFPPLRKPVRWSPPGSPRSM
mgnify:CR=1 FL=1